VDNLLAVSVVLGGGAKLVHCANEQLDLSHLGPKKVDALIREAPKKNSMP